MLVAPPIAKLPCLALDWLGSREAERQHRPSEVTGQESGKSNPGGADRPDCKSPCESPKSGLIAVENNGLC